MGVIRNVDTIAQYKVMQFIQENFEEWAITVTKIDPTDLKVTDKTGDSLVFEYKDGQVKERG